LKIQPGTPMAKKTTVFTREKIFKHTLDEETLGGDPYESEERREETRN